MTTSRAVRLSALLQMAAAFCLEMLFGPILLAATALSTILVWRFFVIPHNLSEARR